ncbi:MAG: hypothetical protein SF069_07140 [Phycisphaerae bacterium]|nr:hypothetical protein [Phycisphaerae bacterium]
MLPLAWLDQGCCAISGGGVSEPGCSVAQDESIVPKMLSAFFGLDDVPGNIQGSFADLCAEDLPIGLTDGMPIVTSVLIDSRSLDATDFRVSTAGGKVFTPDCATLEPAGDNCEGRTILLVGEFGDYPADPPVRVEIVGELLTLDGRDLARTAPPIEVTPLLEGPTLVVAEQVDPTDASAPAGTTLAIRATWAGGINATDGNEVTEAEWGQYALTVRDGNGQEQTVAPFAIGDLNDGDNNHLLFFDVEGEPLSLALPGGLVIDPNGDVNPDTSTQIQ